jgi:diaminopimelate epimerase
MKLPFTKAHGAHNDFLLTWARDVPEGDLSARDLPAMARDICDRHTGVGADGWLIVKAPPEDPFSSEAEGEIRLFNSDGSAAEISGNGTRCAAAFLIWHGCAPGVVRIRTGAGIKTLRLLERRALWFQFEMNMGRPEIVAGRFSLALREGPRDVTLLHTGNPQCAVPVQGFDFDWRALGAEVESHPHFPQRTNVSFLKSVDGHTIEVRFYERGAGETMSSGTGSTGAAAAAILRGMASSPVLVMTPAGPIQLRFEGGFEGGLAGDAFLGDAFLIGPAEIVAQGEFFM